MPGKPQDDSVGKKAESKKKSDEVLQNARKRFEAAESFELDERKEQIDDLKFAEGANDYQWPADVKQDRTAAGKPIITINRLPSFLDQVEGDQRQAAMSIKVRPVDDVADPETAKILEGMIRNIEYASTVKVVRQTAANSAAACGRGHYRILTEYVDDDMFDQDIRIKRLTNTFSVYCDPMSTKHDRSDAGWQFITESIDREEYKERFPGKTPIDFENHDKSLEPWVDQDTVRIAEYFRKVPVTKTLYQIQGPPEQTKGGEAVQTVFVDWDWKPEYEQKGFKLLQTREVKTHEIEWRLIDGNKTLEGPIIWPGRYIPIIEVAGKELFIEGRRVVRGVIRHAKPAQMLYNYARSISAETISLAPKAPYLLTPKEIKGHENQWKKAHRENYIYLLYNPDPSSPSKPTREQPIQASSAVLTDIELSQDEFKSTTGLYDASLGARSNETSGVAITARQREGDNATFAYTDNLVNAVTFEGKILLDLIPKIYDTARMVRILNIDGTHDLKQINYKMSDGTILNDITVGKYDAVITVGPSYTTQRIEAVDSMLKFSEVFPEVRPMIGDLVAKKLDMESEDIEERIRTQMKAAGIIIEPDDEEQELDAQDNPIAPQGDGQEQPDVDPIMAQELAFKSTMNEAELELKQLEKEQEEAKLEGIRLDNQIKEKKLQEPVQ